MCDLKNRSSRVQSAVRLERPDRVPFVPVFGNVFSLEYGVTVKEAMLDNRSLIPAVDALLKECCPDLVYTPDFFPLEVMELLRSKTHSWPGKLPEYGDNFTYQVKDATYLEEDEYEDFLKDPSAFLMHRVLAKKYAALAGLNSLNTYGLTGSTVMGFAQFANPQLRGALQAMLDAGEKLSGFMEGMQAVDMHCIRAGFPIWGNAIMTSPFDDFADNVRGLINTVMDLKTNPQLLAEAVERFGEAMIPEGIANAKRMHAEYVFIPLHLGVDEFMSPKDYETYYWPPLKKLIEALVKENITPMIFCEGNYYTRLHTLKDVPKGKVVYFFEKQDMKKAKEILGDIACIAGNLDTNLLSYGTREAVSEEVKRLLDICAPGGGYMMSNSISLDNCKRENLAAWREAVEKYGNY